MQNVERERQERLTKGSNPARDHTPSPAVQSLKKDQSKPKRELDRGLEDTFPASDPVSATQTTRAGKPD